MTHKTTEPVDPCRKALRGLCEAVEEGHHLTGWTVPAYREAQAALATPNPLPELVEALEASALRLEAIRDFIWADQTDNRIQGLRADWAKACSQANEEAEAGAEEARAALANWRDNR